MTVKELIRALQKIEDKESIVWYLYSNGRRVMCPMNEVVAKSGYVYLNLRQT